MVNRQYFLNAESFQTQSSKGFFAITPAEEVRRLKINHHFRVIELDWITDKELETELPSFKCL